VCFTYDHLFLLQAAAAAITRTLQLIHNHACMHAAAKESSQKPASSLKLTDTKTLLFHCLHLSLGSQCLSLGALFCCRCCFLLLHRQALTFHAPTCFEKQLLLLLSLLCCCMSCCLLHAALSAANPSRRSELDLRSLFSTPTVSRRQAEKKRDAAEESVVRVMRVPTSLRILQSTVVTTTTAKNKI
jgi:hypothetical protein